jgi:hypothetical protein
MSNFSERKSPWLAGLCVVTFDINVGQSLTTLIPDGLLTAQEKSDVAFHAFPVRAGAALSALHGV